MQELQKEERQEEEGFDIVRGGKNTKKGKPLQSNREEKDKGIYFISMKSLASG